VVESALQGPFEVEASPLEAFDLCVEGGEATAGDWFPLFDGVGTEDTIDLVEAEAGVLQHADENKPPDCLGPVAALARDPDIGVRQPPAFVIADGGSGQADPRRDLADAQEGICHKTT
jgi:hypothetical protein